MSYMTFEQANREAAQREAKRNPVASEMTLRDYFAAKAMTAVMPAVMNELKKTRGSVKEAHRLQALSAETCYVLADAMLEARNGTG
jgi:hypothetical protein